MSDSDSQHGNDIKIHRPKDRSVAAILIASGRLTPEKSEEILERQKQTGADFSETGKAMGLLTQKDITFALSRQFEYPYPILDSSVVTKEVAAGHRPYSRQIEALRGVRSRLLLNWLADSQSGKALAIVSPSRSEGRSWLTANLAVLFSQLGERTLIIDADMRNPRQHSMFGIRNQNGLSNVIAGLAGLETIYQCPDFPNLSIMPSGTLPPNPQELVGKIEFAMLLQRLREEYDVILIDSPALEDAADAEAIAARAGSALFVARKNYSKLSLFDQYTTLLHRSSVELAGSVLLD
ncbi:polysaccharide biosynthesis tyrosine autokinase [Hydrocarboniphaga sp.]|uniref:polysaccharide biosynthesis tyrosine autokinase n=1 Tax=Hydrocarboniphaga sp. TaxID=2033016 RepID=UPI003D12B9CC